MLLARGAPGDGTRAAELLAEAVTSFRELGMDDWAHAAGRHAPPRRP